MSAYTVRCLDCQTVGNIQRLSTRVRCTCGSRNLDLIDPLSVTFLEHMGAAHGPGTGWSTTPKADPSGWGEYTGPAPSPNPYRPEPGPTHCPECHGSGQDPDNEGRCRACGGSGRRTPTTEVPPEPQVARHNYPSTQTKVPFMGQRKRADRVIRSSEDVIRNSTPGWSIGDGVTRPDEKFPNISPHLKTRDDEAAGRRYSDEGLGHARQQGFPLHGAPCPECGGAPTQLVHTKNGAWWHCPQCQTPLANIDKHTTVDPYSPGPNFRPQNPKSFSPTASASSGVLLRMVASVTETNPGLNTRQVLTIARQTIQKYSE